MPIEPILTSIWALTDSGLSADTTLAPGTHGTSLFRSLTMVHALSGSETGNDSFNVGILRSSSIGDDGCVSCVPACAPNSRRPGSSSAEQQRASISGRQRFRPLARGLWGSRRESDGLHRIRR